MTLSFNSSSVIPSGYFDLIIELLINSLAYDNLGNFEKLLQTKNLFFFQILNSKKENYCYLVEYSYEIESHSCGQTS
jgi:hypothetical protein